MDWICLLYYVLASLGGGLLSWLMFNNKSRIKEVEANLLREKSTSAELVSQFNKYKMDANARLSTREAEVSLLKKKLENSSKLSPNGGNSEKLSQWKSKAKKLEEKLMLQEKSQSKSSTHTRQMDSLKLELQRKERVIKDKEELIDKLKNKPSFDGKMSNLFEAEIQLLNNQISSYKKKIKKLKKKQKTSTSDLELQKLLSLLNQKSKKRKKRKKKF